MIEDINSYVGGRIREIRKGKRMSIQQLADAINKSKACVSKYEKGEITLDIPTLFEIANVLEVLPERLINYEIKPKVEVGSVLGGTSSFFKASIFAPIILPCFTFNISLQWLGQSVQTLSTRLSCTPNHFPHLSVKQPVGHSSTHVPQKRHSSELQALPNSTEIFAFLPRFAMLIAGLSCIFSHVRKHLPQRMQRLWSLSINGSSRSILSIEYSSGRSISRVKLPIATPRNSQPGRFEHAPQRVAIPAFVGVDFSTSQSSRESQLKHGDGWPLIISSIVRRRCVCSCSVFVRTTIPSAAGVVHEVGVPRIPSISTTQSRHAP